MRFFALSLVLIACPAIAQDDRVVAEVVRRSGYERALVEQYWESGCGEAGPNAQTICTLYSFVDEDIKLNESYLALLKKQSNSAARSKLRTAQLAWLRYRDASCRFESHSEAGLLAAQIINGCMASLTSARRAELLPHLAQKHD